MMKGCSVVVGVLAICVGIFIYTSPTGVDVPYTPPGSYTKLIPPWPVLRAFGPLSDALHFAADALTPPNIRAVNLALSYWKSEILFALARYKVFDAVGDGEVSCESVAKETELSAAILCRYMNVAHELRLLEKTSQGLYKNSDTGHYLRADYPGSMHAFSIMINSKYVDDAWRASSTESLKTGEKGGMLAAHGFEIWDYLSQYPKLSKEFDMAMESFAPATVGAILSDYAPPSPNATFCDIGGGQGTVVSNLLQHYPNAKGKLLDQQHVVEQAIPYLTAQGVMDRMEVYPASFFDPFPTQFASCDVFFMKFIMHDWADDACISILKNIKAAAKPGSVLLNSDFVLGAHKSRSSFELLKAFMDINMLANCPIGSKERSLSDFEALFNAAGIKGKAKVINLRDPISLVEVPL